MKTEQGGREPEKKESREPETETARLQSKAR